MEAVLERFPLLPIDLPTARTHAELWSGLAAAGTPVGVLVGVSHAVGG